MQANFDPSLITTSGVSVGVALVIPILVGFVLPLPPLPSRKGNSMTSVGLHAGIPCTRYRVAKKNPKFSCAT